MAKVGPEVFKGKKIARVYIASRLGEAELVEERLTQSDIDYTAETKPIEVQQFGSYSTHLQGTTFHVLLEQAALSRQLLRGAGLVAGLVDEDHE
jgi:hypothetical protein